MTLSKAPEELEVLAAAKASLLANIETVGSKRYLTAGRRQFRSLWCRDFCYSVRGLLKIGETDVVRDQLSLYIQFRRSQDSLIARGIDSRSPKARVVREVFSRFLGVPNSPIQENLHAEYLNENGTVSIDSNILLVLASLAYLKSTGDLKWWKENESALVEIFKYYESSKDDAVIVQSAYSDWQDSVRRKGCSFLTNLLYWAALRDLVDYPSFGVGSENLDRLHTEIEKRFRDPKSGLFWSLEGVEQISIDGILLALDLDYVKGKDAETLFKSLQSHPLWNGKKGGPKLPGFVTEPDYSKKDVSFTTRIVGLRHYHDRIYWTWLMGLSLKIARKFGDDQKAAEILKTFVRTVRRDGGVGEIYNPSADLSLWSSPWLTAERNFSWGAAFVIDAIE